MVAYRARVGLAGDTERTPGHRRLFITGYLFLVGCNLFGVLLHFSTMTTYLSAATKKSDDTRAMSWWAYATNTIYTATWYADALLFGYEGKTGRG